MNCPNCGAPMAPEPDRSVAAPWTCTHCGTTLTPDPNTVDVTVVDGGAHQCPLCRRALVRALLGGRETIEYCQQCRGMLMPLRAFAQTLIAQRAAATTPGIAPRAPDPRELNRHLTCPQCGDPMLTDWYYGPGGIVIDTCPSCDSVWLDAGELQRAIDAPGPDRRA
jgi:Zn-finger nucleic acid-binding protein